MGRYATGVRVMRSGENERRVTFTRAEHEEDAEVEAIEQPSEEEIAAEMEQAKNEESNEVIEETPIENDDTEE